MGHGTLRERLIAMRFLRREAHATRVRVGMTRVSMSPVCRHRGDDVVSGRESKVARSQGVTETPKTREAKIVLKSFLEGSLWATRVFDTRVRHACLGRHTRVIANTREPGGGLLLHVMCNTYLVVRAGTEHRNSVPDLY